LVDEAVDALYIMFTVMILLQVHYREHDVESVDSLIDQV